jgi:cytochrome c-type biogenesis protein CcmE
MRKRNLKFVVGGVIIAIAIIYLVYSGIQNTALYYLTVSEFKNRGDEAYGEAVRVNGQVLDGSIRWNSKEGALYFTIIDEQNKLPIIHKGVAPDTFKGGAEVVVEGRYTPEDIFAADKIMAKCPSKYEAE